VEPKKRKILIVEDEAVVRDSVRDWLLEDGYEVECAASGEEALDKVRGEDFGILVLDLRLPGIDGLQVFEQAKELRPGTKGIIITAYPSKDTWERAKRLGVLDFLPKPFKATDLEKIIGGALGELEENKVDDKHLWLQIGAVSYRLCDRNYDCASCPLAEQIQDTYETVVLLGEDEIKKLREQTGREKFCRYGSVHFVHRDKPYID